MTSESDTRKKTPVFRLSQQNIQISGGAFIGNEANFGGFLYKEGKGKVSCAGASIIESEALDGGALYLVDAEDLEWECDLIENEALVGPAM